MSNNSPANPASSPASVPLAPTVPEMDLTTLFARRQELTRRQLELEDAGCPYNPNLSEAENAQRQRDHQTAIQQLITEQLRIMAQMRKTTSGPAKAGGKRAKKAPVDLAALDAELFT